MSWMVHGVALTLALPQRPKTLWCHGCLHSHVTYTVKALSPESKVGYGHAHIQYHVLDVGFPKAQFELSV